jgi:alkylated DNA nucleotide flippase Atl1
MCRVTRQDTARRGTGRPDRPGPGLPTPYAEAVLDLVDRIPPGHALSYGDVAGILGSGGARAVGTVMARFGSGVPWHRVVRADGRLPQGHEAEALRRHLAEGTPLSADGSRLDLRRARWRPEGGTP